MKKKCFIFFFVFLLLSIPLEAADMQSLVPDSLYSELPEEIRALIPSDFLTGTSDSVTETLTVGFFTRAIASLIPDIFPEAAESFFLFLGLLVLSSVMRILGESFGTAGIKNVFSYCSALCICGSVFSVTSRVFSLAETYFSALHLFAGKLFPVMIALLYMGGRITSGAVLGGLLDTALALLSSFSNGFLFPVLQILFTFSLGSMLGTDLNLGALASFMKRFLTFFFGAVSLLFTVLLSLQTVVSKSADGLAVKGIKFAVGNLIPIVGNALSDALTTVSGSIGAVRSALGTAAVAVLLLMLLQPLLEILVSKWLYDLASVLALSLSLEKESRFLSEMSGLIGMLAALLSLVSSFFLISLGVLSGIGVG